MIFATNIGNPLKSINNKIVIIVILSLQVLPVSRTGYFNHNI